MKQQKLKRNICICYKISKETILFHLKNNQTKTIKDIIKKTNASTGCGACFLELQKIVQNFEHSKKYILFN